MVKDPLTSRSYWRLLADAEEALLDGRFPPAESRFLTALERRERSPGRVFFTEKLADGLGRLVRRRAEPAPGRWARRAEDFRTRFLAAGESMVREGVRLAELRPEDDAERNQPVLETSLFLVARSRLFLEEPGSAVPLLKGLFRTASRTGRPFDVQLVRHDLPLTEEDRLWMARKGGQLLEAFVEQGILTQGSRESEEWAEVFLQLLQPRYFGATSRLEEERCWLEAVTADRLLGKASTSVDRYRTYLEVNPEPGPRPDEARVRLLELLGNADRVHFAVPRYREAMGAMQSAGLAAGSALSPRYARALARIEYRRPEVERTAVANPAWASAAVEPDGRLAVVFWWDDQPRDVAFWRPGDDATHLDEFLAACEGRIVAGDEAVQSATSGLWEDEPAPWTVGMVLAAVLESRLPAGGLERGVRLRLGLGESAPWRAGWDPALGHPFLEPPRSSSLLETWQQGPAAGALLAGLDWLAVRSRLAGGDPALRAGIGEMASRGDGVSRLLYDFLCMGDAAGRAVDLSFEPWTLPLLWTRPDPFGWTAAGRAGSGRADPDEEGGIRPDLGRNDLAIVATGDAPTVLAAWGEGRQKWRVVLDRLDRLEALSRVAGGVVGPVTVIPTEGTVHCLDAALDLLEDLLRRRRVEPGDEVLPLFHWIRLVETHNGDLLDFRRVRPRADGAVPLYDRYASLVAGVPRERPQLRAGGELQTWADQFSQRVRKAGLVAGAVEQLTPEPDRLDSLWGVFEGSDASWVFLDSAAVHWALLQRGARCIEDLHALLHARGRRHLSLLTGAVWLRTELEELLSNWLRVYGSPYCLSLTDARSPQLRLADRGAVPDGSLTLAEALASQAAWAERVASEEGQVTVRVPASGPAGEFWADVRHGRVAVGGPRWRYLQDPEGREATVAGTSAAAGSPAGRLVIPALASLGTAGRPQAARDTRAEWLRADREREAWASRCRRECALELAALLAGRWSGVDVLDVRWWRLLRSWPLAGAGAPAAAAAAGAWGGEAAAAMAAAGGGRTFDLPGSTAADSGRSAGPFFALASAWLRERQPDEPSPAHLAPAPGRVELVLGDISERWTGLVAAVTAAWERGELSRWILLVSDTCPPGASALVTAAGVDGVTVWAGERGASFPGPVLWTEPEDFADAELRAFLRRHRPAVIVAGDLADWLPAVDRDAQETAVALRALLDCEAARVVLHARALPPPWSAFVAETCGAVVAAGEAPSPATESGPEVSVPAEDGGGAVCLDGGEVDRPAALVRRFRGLLGRLRTLAASRAEGAQEPESAAPPGRQLLPLTWLGCLGGLAAGDVAAGVTLLRWSARLAGEPLSTAAAAAARRVGHGDGHALLIPGRFADIEQQLDRIEEHLVVLLPLWLSVASPPSLTWIDLEQPPARIPPRELALLDTYLVMTTAQAGGARGLVYHCPRGLLYSTRRLVGVREPWERVALDIQEQLQLFRARIREVMSAAVETGDGFLVETGLMELRADESRFLALGAALGFWRWLGPASDDALHLVDLLSLADSPTVKAGHLGWRLLSEAIGGRYARPEDAATAAASGPPEPGRSRLSLRHLLAGGGEEDGDFGAAVERVGQLAGGESERSFLVLKGWLGSGRHEALARGLVWARRHAADPGEITVYCPDHSTAAMVTREAVRRGLTGPLDIRIPEAGAVIELGQPGGAALADPGGAVVVMCEVQRFEPETRYRIAQLGRGRRLLMTVDPLAATEPWEHLFLTTPRSDDVLELTGQRRLARRLWTPVARIVAEGQAAVGPFLRRDKGRLIAEYAANLDQCLARVAAARESGEIGERVRLTAPLPGDLEYLGANLLERGWVAVRESRLDFLLLPGPREVLAAATDCLAAAGVLTARFGAGPAAGGTAAGAAYEPILPRLLGPRAARASRGGAGALPRDPEAILADLVVAMGATAWGDSCLAFPAARRRVDELLGIWGRERLSALTALPLWEAWWYSQLDDLALDAPPGRPLAVLTESARLPGSFMPSGVYLCQGSEPAGRHYEVLGRICDQALVLYQEISPLPGEGP